MEKEGCNCRELNHGVHVREGKWAVVREIAKDMGWYSRA